MLKMNKVVITQLMPQAGIDYLKNQNGYHLVCEGYKDSSNYDWIYDNIRNADALWCVVSDKIDKKLLDHAENLKIIASLGVGYDHIDLKEAQKRNIAVALTKTKFENILAPAAADYAVTLLTGLARRLPSTDRYVRRGGWSDKNGFISLHRTGYPIHNTTLGIIGLGDIGRTVAKRFRDGFDMKILYNDLMEKDYARKLKAKYTNLENLLKKSDFVILTVDLNETTKGLIGKKELEMMKPTSHLINISRGPVVVENDLIDALKKNKIAGAALDVYEKEPLPKDHPLLDPELEEKLILSPHIATDDYKTRDNMALMCVRSMVDVLNGEKPDNLVDFNDVIRRN